MWTEQDELNYQKAVRGENNFPTEAADPAWEAYKESCKSRTDWYVGDVGDYEHFLRTYNK